MFFIKEENHIVQKFINNLITLDEARLELGYDSDVDAKNTYASIQGDIQIDVATGTAKAQATNAPPDPKTSDGQKSAPAGQRNLPSKKKGVGNAMRPINQNGRKTSPDIKRFDNNFLSVIESLLDNEYTVVESDVTKEDDNV